MTFMTLIMNGGDTVVPDVRVKSIWQSNQTLERVGHEANDEFKQKINVLAVPGMICTV